MSATWTAARPTARVERGIGESGQLERLLGEPGSGGGTDGPPGRVLGPLRPAQTLPNAPDEAWSHDPSSVAVPTLVISGRRDRGELGDLAAALPLGALVTIEAGHWIHETAPDAFVATVRRFLDGG